MSILGLMSPRMMQKQGKRRTLESGYKAGMLLTSFATQEEHFSFYSVMSQREERPYQGCFLRTFCTRRIHNKERFYREKSLQSWALHGQTVPGVFEGNKCPVSREQTLALPALSSEDQAAFSCAASGHPCSFLSTHHPQQGEEVYLF